MSIGAARKLRQFATTSSARENTKPASSIPKAASQTFSASSPTRRAVTRLNSSPDIRPPAAHTPESGTDIRPR